MEQRLDRADHLPVVQSLGEVGFMSITDLLATYAGYGPDLKVWLEGAQINRDRNLRLQYMAGMGLNNYQEGRIYDAILDYCGFPEQLFVGSSHNRAILREAIAQAQQRR
jgi:spermidine synthase